jgi:arsenate reductase-like glutaredoxin family protein
VGSAAGWPGRDGEQVLHHRRQLPDNRKAADSEAEWKLLLREYPQLIKRPLVVTADGTVSQGFSDNGFKARFGVGAA